MASDRLTSNKTEKVGRKCDKKSRQIRKWRRREDGSKDGKAERLLVSFYDAESDHVFFLSFFTVFIAFTRISERFFYLKKNAGHRMTRRVPFSGAMNGWRGWRSINNNKKKERRTFLFWKEQRRRVAGALRVHSTGRPEISNPRFTPISLKTG